MTARNCIICGSPLQGLQRKFCSKKCSKRADYLKNALYYRQKIKEWIASNKEKRKIYVREYQHENKAKLNLIHNRKRKRRIEHYRAYQRQYYNDHREQMRERMRIRAKKRRDRIQIIKFLFRFFLSFYS